MIKKLPTYCPACSAQLKVKSLCCDHCETEVNGLFNLPMISRLNEKDQQFILEFIKCSGSLKIMAQKLGLSYPTVRNLLDEIITRINNIENEQSSEK